MTTYKINPQAHDVNIHIEFDIQRLETLGWDFDEVHSDTAAALGVSVEDAAQRNYAEYSCYIVLQSNDGGKIKTYWYWQDRNNNTGDKAATGDDEQTINDIIQEMSEGALVIDDRSDYTTDKDGYYVPTFIKE